MEKLWTTAEVAQFLGISEDHISRLVREGKLTGYKLGGKFVRFKPEQVKALKPSMTTSPAARAPVKAQTGAQAVAIAQQPWPNRVRDFLYFYDFYILSFTLLAGVFIYLVWSGG